MRFTFGVLVDIDSLDHNPVELSQHFNHLADFPSIITSYNFDNIALHDSPAFKGFLEAFALVFLWKVMGPFCLIKVKDGSV